MTKKQLAEKITEKWLGDAPLHICKPQIKELMCLSIKQLDLILKNTIDPISLEVFKEIVEIDPLVIIRLQSRRNVARIIREAEDMGLYDMVEHLTSKIDLDD